MKTVRLCIGFLLMSSLPAKIFAQDTSLLASANQTPRDGTAAIDVDSGKETEESTFTLSGTIDTYFHTTFGTVNPYMGGYAPSTAFADLKGFGLGMVNMVAAYEGEKAGFTADLVFGPRGKAAVFAAASGQSIVNQMFAWYKLSDKVTVKLGQFNTFLGYEVISPAVNFHYSTSYMFSWGPFSHTGLRADVDLGNGWSAMAAIMNPTDLVEFNPVNTYTLGAQLGHTSEAGGIWLNLIYGDQDGKLEATDYPYLTDDDGDILLDENGDPMFIASGGPLFQVDITTGWNLSEKFYLGLNTTFQSLSPGERFITEGSIADNDAEASSFYGVAIYPKVTLSESFALGLRAEYLAVTREHLSIFGMNPSGKGNVTEFTLSGNYKVGGLTFIPEVRIDMTSEDSFMDADGKATNMLPSLNVAAVYQF